ncbi:MAG: allophanate hydrolase [Hyphomicrobium sp.]
MIGSLDCSSLRTLYKEGLATPEQVTREVFARIKCMGTRPVWITLVPEEEALYRARSAPRGPLFGLPFAVKDNIDVAGLPTTCGCPEFAYMPARSATVVDRLEAAGAILIGKTNLDQFATGLVGVRSPYGMPTSVFNPEYISGGSSSGSAVAVASGLVSFALGTDTAGSGRVPAAFNNIVGLKPAKGLISTRGVVPACRTLDAVSIFSMTVADAASVLSIAAAFDSEDIYSRRPPRSIVAGKELSGLRVGIPKGPMEFFGDSEAEKLYLASIGRITGLGANIAEIDFAPFREAAQLLYAGPWVAERLAAIKEFAASQPEAIHEVVRSIIMSGESYSAVSAFEGLYRLAGLIRTAEVQWKNMDILLLPTTGTTYKIADVLADPVRLNSNLGAYTNFVNLMDLSALAVPAGFRTDGLPFGVTLIGRAFDDGCLATAGDQLHRSLKGARLGGTTTALDDAPAIPAAYQRTPAVQVAVIGAHLSGQPLNCQLAERNARLVRSARTAPGYSFYALANTTPSKPGLIFDGEGAGGIEVEIWEMDEAAFGSFVALIPRPLGIGTIQLDDGETVKGFLCEAIAARDAQDITPFGGWRAWLGSIETA